MRQTFDRRSVLGICMGSAAGAALLASGAPSYAATTTFKADLKGSSEVPPNTTSGTGSVTATYDPAKARAITETVLQQHPDLCGIVGNWDNQDVGAGAAVQAAGKSDQVYIVTSGGGSKTGCDNIEKGLLDLIVSYDVPLQGDSLNQAIVELLLSPAKAGEIKSTYFTPLTLQTKETISSRNCWTLDQLK